MGREYLFVILVLDASGKHPVYDVLHTMIVLKHVRIFPRRIRQNIIVHLYLRLDVLVNTVSWNQIFRSRERGRYR